MPTYPSDQGQPGGAIPVYLAGGTGDIPPGATIEALAVSQITTGGTAVTAASGPIAGGYIQNPASAISQGIGTAETLFVNFFATAGTLGQGSTMEVSPGVTLPLPNLTTGQNVSVNANTSGHHFNGLVYVPE